MPKIGQDSCIARGVYVSNPPPRRDLRLTVKGSIHLATYSLLALVAVPVAAPRGPSCLQADVPEGLLNLYTE